MKRGKKSSNIIITTFAVVHTIVALLFHLYTIGDGWLLTILTIVMIFMIAALYNTPKSVTAAVAILSCFAGYFIGNSLAAQINIYIPYIFIANGLSTFITTTILGWISYFIFKR